MPTSTVALSKRSDSAISFCFGAGRCASCRGSSASCPRTYRTLACVVVASRVFQAVSASNGPNGGDLRQSAQKRPRKARICAREHRRSFVRSQAASAMCCAPRSLLHRKWSCPLEESWAACWQRFRQAAFFDRPPSFFVWRGWCWIRCVGKRLCCLDVVVSGVRLCSCPSHVSLCLDVVVVVVVLR